jgi:hypothetical protein
MFAGVFPVMSIGKDDSAALKIRISFGITSMPLGVIEVFFTTPFTPMLYRLCKALDFDRTSLLALFRKTVI